MKPRRGAALTQTNRLIFEGRDHQTSLAKLKEGATCVYPFTALCQIGGVYASSSSANDDPGAPFGAFAGEFRGQGNVGEDRGQLGK